MEALSERIVRLTAGGSRKTAHEPALAFGQSIAVFIFRKQRSLTRLLLDPIRIAGSGKPNVN
jgi:hypothetical protein